LDQQVTDPFELLARGSSYLAASLVQSWLGRGWNTLRIMTEDKEG
jgi:hypothetical protein